MSSGNEANMIVGLDIGTSKVVAIVGNAGDVNTGIIDPLPEITPYESFTYVADKQGLRSPFKPDTPQASGPSAGGTRRSPGLEAREQHAGPHARAQDVAVLVGEDDRGDRAGVPCIGSGSLPLTESGQVDLDSGVRPAARGSLLSGTRADIQIFLYGRAFARADRRGAELV